MPTYMNAGSIFTEMDKGIRRKTTSGKEGIVLNLTSPRGQWKIVNNGDKWLQSHRSCPNEPRGCFSV